MNMTAEQIADAGRTGAPITITGGRHTRTYRLSRTMQERFCEAIRQGYLIAPARYSEQLDWFWFRWTEAADRPYIVATVRTVWCDVKADLIACSYAFTDDALAAIEARWLGFATERGYARPRSLLFRSPLRVEAVRLDKVEAAHFVEYLREQAERCTDNRKWSTAPEEGA